MSRQASPRMRKINELLREVIADEVGRLKDPRLGFVTITGVDTAPDLRTAVVYYSVLGDEDAARGTAAALGSASAKLQAFVASQARIKYTPRLTFAVDESIDRGLRISKLLQELDEQEDH
jgi:ribosome-binding factor A